MSSWRRRLEEEFEEEAPSAKCPKCNAPTVRADRYSRKVNSGPYGLGKCNQRKYEGLKVPGTGAKRLLLQAVSRGWGRLPS